eukprot:6189480-Pleurochrysis_carterae.AAC.4
MYTRKRLFAAKRYEVIRSSTYIDASGITPSGINAPHLRIETSTSMLCSGIRLACRQFVQLRTSWHQRKGTHEAPYLEGIHSLPRLGHVVHKMHFYLLVRTAIANSCNVGAPRRSFVVVLRSDGEALCNCSDRSLARVSSRAAGRVNNVGHARTHDATRHCGV